MIAQSQFQLSQIKELAPRSELAGAYELTYTFSRSAERQKRDYPGADYLSFSYNDSQLFFSVCDGVSGAFAGYVGAKFIGDQLINWSKRQKETIESVAILEKKLSQVLLSWIKDGTKLVNSTRLLINGDETDREFMERRRQKGSQTMFLLGILDVEQDKAFFAGLGDIRISIKYNNNENDFIVGQTKDRWSTLEGQMGDLWVKSYKLSEINRFTVYTDGFEQFSKNPLSIQEKSEINNVVHPKDDVTFFSVKPSRNIRNRNQYQTPRYQIKDNYIVFDKVNDGEWIRVFVEDDILEITNSKIFLNEDFKSAGKGQLRYQVVGEKAQPSEIKLLKLDGELEPQKTTQPVYIRERRKPVINKPVISDPVKPISPLATAPLVQKKQRVEWLKYFGVLGLVLALISWIITAYFFLQIEKKREEINNLNKQVATQQALLLEYKAAFSVTPVFTMTPAATETSIPVKILYECVMQEGGLQVFKVPDISSLPTYIMPAGRKFSVLQDSEDQRVQEWLFISDLEIPFEGWLRTQDLDLSKNCTAKQ